jgi:hypothetical protein
MEKTNPVEFQPTLFHILMILWQLQLVANDLPTKMPVEMGRCDYEPRARPRGRSYSLVDHTGRGEFGLEPIAKNLGETTLVMVEALLSYVVHTADVDNDITRFEDGRVP